jgi:hypothetical protein
MRRVDGIRDNGRCDQGNDRRYQRGRCRPLSQPLKAPAGTRQLGQIRRPLNRYEKIDVLGDSLSGCHRTQKCNALYTWTETRSPHKGISRKK